MRIYGVIFLGLGLSVFAAGQALATPSCVSTDYCSTNGSEAYPGTFVGTIGTAGGDFNQIGNVSLYNTDNGGAYLSSPSASPSIYEFYWGGGNLDITEEQGNNGTGSIDAELASLSGQTATSPSAILSSISLGQSGFALFTLYNASLSAGYYAIDTYYGTVGTDPNYQIDFAGTPTSVPEPITLSLFGAGLAGAAAVRRRRKAIKKT